MKAKSHVGHELGRPSTEDGGAQTGEFGAGKVVWANEGFEKLAGVDAFDIVGQDIISLFQEGGDTEDEKGGELKRNLELSTVSFLGTTGEVAQNCHKREERWVTIKLYPVPP